MKIFDAYAGYYDLLYKDKNHDSEVDYIEKLIKEYKPHAKTILNFGCGTGRHDFILADLGYNLTGVDSSARMIDIANEKLEAVKNKPALKFFKGDIRNIDMNEKYDIIISLFHVVSYQTSNEDVSLTLLNASRHLAEGGIFIFDLWYGPAVLTQRPEIRTKMFEDKQISAARISTPFLRINENIVEVKFNIEVKQRQTEQISQLEEIHNMRYFFLPEIEYFLKNAGMSLHHHEEWMTGNVLTDGSWTAVIISKVNE